MNQKIFYNKTINKKELKTIIHSTFEAYGVIKATKLVENLKKSGFYFATQAGISISIEDLKVPPTKDPLFYQNTKEIKLAYFYEKRGNINEIERFQKVIDTWHNTSDSLKNQLIDFFKTIDPLNPVYIMAFSGARGNLSQVRQLVGMRGLMADPNGQIIDLPIKANFREGLTITDYVISSYGARKGIVDTALKTADSGYLTRRLVDVAQHVIIRELDCKTKNGIRLYYDKGLEKIGKFIGRITSKPVLEPKTKKIIIPADTILTVKEFNKIKFSTEIILRSPLVCESSHSICQKCYGWNLAQSQLVELADAVGVIAAQSIGEPGTQLTMRTFHTGGVFTGESSNQIRSSENGTLLFDKNLRTTVARTIYGEIILKAENHSYLYILTDKKSVKKIQISPEMLILTRNQSEILKGDLIAEIPSASKQTTKEIKNVTSSIEGEIQFQNIKIGQQNSSTNNGLVWITSGQVYDIYENMRIKKSNQTIIKNNALTQTKVITPLNGFVKYTNSGKQLEISIINGINIIPSDSVYKKDGKDFLYLNNKYLFQLNKDTIDIPLIASEITKKYELPLACNIFQGKNKKHVYIINPVYPEKFFNQINNLIFEIQINEYNIEENFVDNNILFPGENIFEKITIKTLCYVNVIKSNETTILIKLNPLSQCLISTQEEHILKNNEQICPGLKLNTKLNLRPKKIKDYNETFLNKDIKFQDHSNIPGFKLIRKVIKNNTRNYNQIIYLLIYQLPITLAKLNTKISNPIINYNITQNQYIEKYTTIATIANKVLEKTTLKAIKNLRQRSTRLLLTTAKNYKHYQLEQNTNLQISKFILIDDKIDSNLFAAYSGYNINDVDHNLKIRISTPFFISTGTRILVQHGSLINKDESLCQLIYNRVISNDIITGLPRVENLFEARIDKSQVILIENPGIVKQKKEKEGKLIILEKQKLRTYDAEEENVQFLTKKGEIVYVGQPINNIIINPHAVLATYFKYYCSFYAAQQATLLSVTNIQILLLKLVQQVYTSQGVDIADKHIEIIIRQITSKVKILSFNINTFFIPNEFMEFNQVNYINTSLKSIKEPLIAYQPVLLGITKVSLMTESFISAASFQETTRILAQAAVEGQIEWLRGLKENVILGRLIPAGTGFKSFNSSSLLNIRLDS